MKRLLAFLRRLFPGNPPARVEPFDRERTLVDWPFIRGSFRNGEAFDPLSPMTAGRTQIAYGPTKE